MKKIYKRTFVLYLLIMIVLVVVGCLKNPTEVGYKPHQAVSFSHKTHAGNMKINCKYCHYTANITAEASLPSSRSCIECHRLFEKDNPKLELVYNSTETGAALAWISVCNLPDFVYFNHSAHIKNGMDCAACHGKVETMKQTFLAIEFSMAWCLECHQPDNGNTETSKVASSANCSTCHR
jgi:menaquinone reductase, multiheme cytochrome c subunit